jgi:Zn-dependent peptidase ImmA (M78 family)
VEPSIGYLFLPSPPVEPVPLPDLRTMPGGERSPSPNFLDMVYVCQQRQEWYRDHARINGEEPLAFVGSVRVGDDVLKVAAAIRAQLGYGLETQRSARTWTDALRDFIGHANAAGIMVMCSGVVLNKRPLDPEEFRGFAMADALAPLVFVNGADTKAAPMFTLAHELAHVWLGQSGISDAQAGRASARGVEEWCNRVAAELLVPLNAIRREYRPAAELRGEYGRLARVFKVSSLVVLRRIYDLGGITREQLWHEYQLEVERLKALPSRGSGGNFYLTEAARVSKRFARALIVSTLEGQTLYRDAFRMLGLSKHSTFEALSQKLDLA